MLDRIVSFVKGLLTRKPVRLAIVRRYADANGNYVGELYMEQKDKSGLSVFNMIGVSLDSLPLDYGARPSEDSLHLVHELRHGRFTLDTSNDFLAIMPTHTIRVGAMDPVDNDRIRKMVARLSRNDMTFIVQNRFIEYVLESGKGDAR